MVNTDLSRFRLKVREYRLLVNRNQSELAAYLNLDYNELSNRLNAHKKAPLSHDNVRGIIRALADWGAISTRAQAEELLDLMLCPHFDEVDWQAKPLSKLIATPNPLDIPPISVSTVSASLSSVQSSNAASLSLFPPLPLAAGPEPVHNLPRLLSSFVGREQEIAELKKLVIGEKAQLVTLVGAGGSGKTRLGLELAGQILDQFADGIWLAELAPLNNPALVPQAIAQTLGIVEQPGKNLLDTLVQYLRRRPLLLILDNCEHLIEECARVVEKLLKQTAHLQILATSREGLGITGEITYRVPSLSLPLPGEVISSEKLGDYSALALFMERATAARPDFKLAQKELEVVAQICQRLDGIPLALELAAARTRVLSLAQIQTRLTDRFQLLSSGSRTALPRQQTLRALVEWSYNLLSEEEKRLFARVSIFAGSWSLAAAEMVGSGVAGLEKSEVLDGLASLVNKSLIVVDKSGEEVRYHLLETIRQYGLEQLEALGEAAAVRQRHLDYYTTLAGKLALEWHTGRQPHLVKVLDQELDNIRVAISNGLGSRQIEVVLELVICLGLYWDMRGYYTEELGYLDQVLALSGGSKISQGKILGRAGFVALRRGDISAARHYYERSLALDETQTNNEVQGRTLTGLGLMHYSQGNYAKARSYLEKVLALSEEMNEFYKSAAQTNLSMVSLEEGKYQEAARLLGSSMALARKQGGQWSLVLILVNLARLAMLEEDYAQAGRFCEEARALSREIGFKYGTSLALAYLGMALYHQARFKEAGAALDESLILVLKDASFPIYHILVGVSGLLSKIWLKKREVRLAEQIACVSGTISAWLASSSNALIVPMRAILSKPWK